MEILCEPSVLDESQVIEDDSFQSIKSQLFTWEDGIVDYYFVTTIVASGYIEP